jgi:hypothetical protein
MQLSAMLAENWQKLVVFDIPKSSARSDLTHKAEMGQQLA